MCSITPKSAGKSVRWSAKYRGVESLLRQLTAVHAQALNVAAMLNS
jgi:hypothetical protein